MPIRRMATGNSLLRAYSRAVRVIKQEGDGLLATSQDAGFIMPNGNPKGEGYQVFVRVVRFSEDKLLRDISSGGLLA